MLKNKSYPEKKITVYELYIIQLLFIYYPFKFGIYPYPITFFIFKTK